MLQNYHIDYKNLKKLLTKAQSKPHDALRSSIADLDQKIMR